MGTASAAHSKVKCFPQIEDEQSIIEREIIKLGHIDMTTFNDCMLINSHGFLSFYFGEFFKIIRSSYFCLHIEEGNDVVQRIEEKTS